MCLQDVGVQEKLKKFIESRVLITVAVVERMILLPYYPIIILVQLCLSVVGYSHPISGVKGT